MCCKLLTTKVSCWLFRLTVQERMTLVSVKFDAIKLVKGSGSKIKIIIYNYFEYRLNIVIYIMLHNGQSIMSCCNYFSKVNSLSLLLNRYFLTRCDNLLYNNNKKRSKILIFNS